MADGLWTGVGATEVLRQKDLIRHRLLRFNTSAAGAVALSGGDASSHGQLDPNAMAATLAPAGGPHFVMSPQTPDGRPTLGFEWGICDAAGVGILPGEQATFAAGGVQVTVWELVSATFFPNGIDTPIWAAMTPITVQPNTVLRSFDVNATCLRFQIGPTGLTADGSVVLFFSEL